MVWASHSSSTGVPDGGHWTVPGKTVEPEAERLPGKALDRVGNDEIRKPGPHVAEVDSDETARPGRTAGGDPVVVAEVAVVETVVRGRDLDSAAYDRLPSLELLERHVDAGVEKRAECRLESVALHAVDDIAELGSGLLEEGRIRAV